MAPSTTGVSSLPDDRSLWPYFLSNGALPPPSTILAPDSALLSPTNHRSSSSVPANPAVVVRSSSTGPRLYDYSLPLSATTGGGITRVRPGVLGVPTGSVNGDSSTPFSGNSRVMTP